MIELKKGNDTQTIFTNTLCTYSVFPGASRRICRSILPRWLPHRRSSRWILLRRVRAWGRRGRRCSSRWRRWRSRRRRCSRPRRNGCRRGSRATENVTQDISSVVPLNWATFAKFYPPLFYWFNWTVFPSFASSRHLKIWKFNIFWKSYSYFKFL